ncbi:TOPRIM nucleotidyl transferase/hydrolase domain-containing protein [Staphylococcus epidermidis]
MKVMLYHIHLEEKGFALLSTGGSGNLKSWINLKVIEQFNIPWCILQDSDIGPNDENANREKKQELESKGIKMYLTKKREVEKYKGSDGNIRYEFTEMINDFLSIVD